MKKIRMSLLLLLLLPIVAGSGASNVFAETTLSGAKKDSNILVAYFSRAVENYGVGVVKKGNTQILADFIAQELKSDSFHIQTLTPTRKITGNAQMSLRRSGKIMRARKLPARFRMWANTTSSFWATRFGGETCRWRCTHF